MTRLLCVRHGRAHGGEGRCIGHHDLALAPDGAQAIRELLPRLREHIAGDVLICASDLRRAHDSALIIAAALGANVRTDARLRELSFGEWEGQTWNELNESDHDRLHAWMGAWMTAPPGGESVQQLAERVESWLAEHRTFDGTVVAVAHAGWIRAAVCLLLVRPLAQLFDVEIGYAGMIAIQSRANGSADPIL